jgi:hypothetical protein
MKGVLWVIVTKTVSGYEFVARQTRTAKLRRFKSKHSFYKYLRNTVRLGHTCAMTIIDKCISRPDDVLPFDLSSCRIIKKNKAYEFEQKYYQYLDKLDKIRKQDIN